jgi:hypothetical protein
MAESSAASYASQALVSMVLACVLLQGAPFFANLAYREPVPEIPVE